MPLPINREKARSVMNQRFHLQGIAFEWDEEKARINAEKHGITFEEAATVFFDPFRIFC